MNQIRAIIKSFILPFSGVIIPLFLCISILAVYGQIQGHDFINYDDNEYVVQNRPVQGGFTPDSIIWAFTSIHAGNWHPVTWLSHMLDCRLFGLTPGRHHLTSLLFHIVNTLLLFFIFKTMTGKMWQSAFVSALFGLHPLHVESVAWVAERKDLLSAFFFLLTLWSYFRYVTLPSYGRYLPVLLFFALGLMSKPMLVTLPFVLLLLDLWPLCRLRFGRPHPVDSRQKAVLLRLMLEKTPLFLLAGVSSMITFYAQKHGGAVKSLEMIPFSARVANAVVSYIGYIGKMVYPVDLAFLYPHPVILPGWKVAGACFVLGCISFFAVRIIKQHPYVAVGWLWYLGTLIPVIGLVQVGNQAMADRYTYIPMIGLFIILAFGIGDFTEKWRRQKIVLALSAGVILSCLMAVTFYQAGYWKNSITLFEHAIQVTSDNSIAHYNLANVYAKQGKTDQAVGHYLQTLALNPDFADAHVNLGNAYNMQGRLEEAVDQYLQALKLKPDYPGLEYNLGAIFDRQEKIEEAIGHYLRAIQLNPDYEEAYFNLGVDLFRKKDYGGAISNFRQVLRINPENAPAKRNLEKAVAVRKNIPSN